MVSYVLVGDLANGATCICYDGSPLYPDARFMMLVLEHHKVPLFGISPRYLLELESAGCIPREEFNISALKETTTTGAPLTTDQYHFVYRTFPSHVLLANQAGSTDVATALIGGDPDGPLYASELQVPHLGIDVIIADVETGKSVKNTGRDGEKLTRKPFPSMPPFFWADPDGRKYQEACFEKWGKKVDVWAVGDWLSYNPVTKGWVMQGRSDGALNPSGIGFGSVEIYAIVESPPFTTIYGIGEVLCVGRFRPSDHDEAVFLFVRMQPGHSFSEQLRQQLKTAIGSALSKRHVPKFVVEVPEIPVTVNGKKAEIAVKKIISGRDVEVSSTVVNPDCLGYHRRFRELEAEERAVKL